MTLKVGDQVVRVDGYSRGVVIAVIKDLDELNPFHQVSIRQRRNTNPLVKGDTVVTRDIDGYTESKYEQYRFVKKPETKTVTKYYLHYVFKSEVGDGKGDPTVRTGAYKTEAERGRISNYSDIVVLKLSEETFTYEVPEKK